MGFNIEGQGGWLIYHSGTEPFVFYLSGFNHMSRGQKFGGPHSKRIFIFISFIS